MKYMMLVYAAEGAWTQEELLMAREESKQLCHELAEQGRYLGASPLHPVSTATCVRVRGDKRLITAGPFAETTEHLGGYFLVEADNMDEAVSIAGQIPGARKGTVEIRPVFELAGLPKVKS